MTARYSREQVDAVLRAVHTGTLHRIVLRMGLNDPLVLRAGKSRFCDGRSYAVLYAASRLETAFVETVVRDRFVQTDRRVILLDEVRSRGCVEYTLRGTHPLHLVHHATDRANPAMPGGHACGNGPQNDQVRDEHIRAAL